MLASKLLQRLYSVPRRPPARPVPFQCDALERRLVLSAPGGLAAAAPPPDSPGVYVRFFDNTTRTGEPAAAEVAPAIDFDFGDAAPRPGVPADGFSVRFSGTLRAPVAGLYTFVTESDDGAVLWIQNVDVINDPGPHAAAHRESNRTFEWAAGSQIPFTLDTFDAAGDAVARLKWVRPGGPGEPATVFETIPASAFVSARRRAPNTAPPGLTLKGSGSDLVVVDFDGSAAADGYEIEVLAPDGSTARTVATGIEGGPVIVDGLSPSVQYTARVRAVSVEAGPTPWTTIHFVFSGSEFQPIFEPTYLGPRDGGYIPAGATHLRFRDNAFNETGYVLLRRNAGESQSVELARFPAAEGMGSIIEYVDTQTVPNRRYLYELYATGEGGRRSAAASESLQPVVSGAGLRATLFETADFGDDPAVDGDPYELLGASLDEDWGDGGPAALRSTDDFSVLLRGSFRPRFANNTFYTASAGGIALKITDYETGQTVLDFNRLDVERDMPLFGFQDIAGQINLRAGYLYGIEVRYVERSGTAGYRVGWNWWDGAGALSRATLPLPLLFEPPPPPGSPLPAFTALSATTVGVSRVFVHFDDTFATESAFELLYSNCPDGPFERTGDRAAPGSSEIASYLPLWADRHFFKVRAVQPEPTIPFVDSEAIEVLEPIIEYEIRRDRFESAAGFNLSGSAQVADGRLRLTDAGAPAGGAALSANLVYLYHDGFVVDFDFQTTAAAGPTALSFVVRREHAHPDDPHAVEFRLAAAPGESNLNSAMLLLDGIAQGAPRAVPAAAPDLDFDRVTPGGTLPPRVVRVRLEYLSDDDTLELTVSDAANPAEKFHASFPMDLSQVFGDTITAHMGLAAAAGDGGARQEVLNFNYYHLPPGIVAVYVRSSTWLGQDNSANTTFMEYLEAKGLGDDVLGYRVMGRGRTPPASNPDDIIPWINVDQIVIRFGSVPFTGSIPTPGSFSVSGRNPAASSYTVTDVWPVVGDPKAFLLRLNKPLGGGNPVANTTPTTTENGDRITLTIPGGGAGGTNFSMRMNVLQGDVDHLNETVHNVLARDYAEVKKRFFKNTNTAPSNPDTDYTPFHDIDGNGQILATDYARVKSRFFHNLPAAPAAPAPFDPLPSVTSDLYSDERVLPRRVRSPLTFTPPRCLE